MANHHVRFAVRSPDGATTDIWKCWTRSGTGKRDVYLTSRPLGNAMKLSMHESGRWHVSFHMDKKDTLFSPQTIPASRFLGVWDRSSALASPYILGAKVLFPWTSPTMPPREAPVDTKWLMCAGKGEMVEVSIFLVNVSIGSDEWPGKQAMGAGLVGRMPLDGGGEVILVYRYAEMVKVEIPGNGRPTFFRGQTNADLLEANRTVVWGDSPEGTISFVECRLTIETDGKA
jgi:hypothetical protein